MDHSVQCVHCKAVLKSSAPVPAGKKVKCPKCQQVFTVGAMPATGVAKEAAAADATQSQATQLAAAEAQATKLAPPEPKAQTPAEDVVEPEPEAVDPEDVVEPESEAVDPEQDGEETGEAPEGALAEGEAPPAPKKARRDEDEDAPRASKKKRRDDDDEPRSQKKRRDDGKKRSSKGAKKKKAAFSLLYVLLGGGGILGLFACCGCGIGAYFMFGGSPIVGQWEMNDPVGVRIIFNFYRNRTGTVGTNVPGDPTFHFDYETQGSNPMFVELTATRIEGRAAPGDNFIIGEKVRFRAAVTNDTLTLTPDDVAGRFRPTVKLRRSK